MQEGQLYLQSFSKYGERFNFDVQYFLSFGRFMSLMQALVQCLDGYIPLVVELDSLGDQGMDAGRWHAHLGSEGGDLVASSGNSWPAMTLAMSFSTTGPSGRQVNGPC